MTELLPVMPRYETYKDSGMAWIGEIPKSWVLIRGSYIFKIINKRSKNGNEALLTVSEHHGVKLRAESNVNMFMAESYVGYKICYPGDLVINSLWAWSRGLGFSNIHGIVSTAYSVFRPDTFKYDKSFLNYLLRTKKYVDQYFIASKGIWISRLQLSDSAFLKIPILSPPISEQTTIAKFLDCKTAKIDQAVAIKEKQIQLLKERKQILIQTAVTKGLDPNVPMADSGVERIGQIPAHWKVKRLRFIGQTQNGISAGADYFGSGYPFVSYSDVYNNRELPRSVKGLATSSINDQIHYSVEKGDVLFTRTSETIEEIGFSSACMETIPNSTFAGFLIRFRPKPGILEPGYSKYYFCANMQRAYFVGKMNIVIRASLSQELLKNLPVLLPPKKEQKSIYAHIENQSAKIDKAIEIQAQMIEKLKEYKATLINAAVTGKIKVPDPAESKVVA
ncbi:restriction endonuclease subunit S [Desulfobacter sp.]|uniref:restriction endonuclease subunit S n=1 Tax=Desulfobacter sp. TaxID=2294 RepID=UPI003D0DAFB2